MTLLSSVKIVEFAALGPAPFAAMTLADLGAEVTRITRAGQKPGPGTFLERGRQNVRLDLKTQDGQAEARRLIAAADVVIEGYRPGKMESLGFGPAELNAINPRLVFARMTGWGQTGPLAHTAGHDINYLALSGVLSLLGEAGKPPLAPLNLVADFGGGGMYLALGIVSALLKVRESGQGQIVDAAMVHGATHLASMPHAWIAAGKWSAERQDNLLDGGAPFYRCYEVAGGRHIAVGALEPQFFAVLVERLGLDQAYLGGQHDRALWPQMQADTAATLARHPLEHWVAHFDGTDACVTPVLTMSEAQEHPQMAGAFVRQSGVLQPAPAPRVAPLAG